MLLSPLAQPYQPKDVPAGIVFNDGVPSAMLSDHDIVQGYTGEALDENFPPSAQDAAELEAVEMFVDIMATLAMMEENEERARTSFCHIQKRWEARREDGLVKKPRPAKHSVDAVDHSGNHGSTNTVTTTDLVSFAHSHHRLAGAMIHENRIRAREDFRRVSHHNNKGNKNSKNHRKAQLQQPRGMAK